MHLKRLRELTENLIDRDFLLKKKQEMLESLLDSSPIPFLIWIIDLNLMFVNNEDLGKISNISLKNPTEFIGSTVYDYFKTKDPEAEPIKYILQAIKGETVSYWLSHEGRTLWNKCTPIYDYSGNVIGAMCITWNLPKCVGGLNCLQDCSDDDQLLDKLYRPNGNEKSLPMK